MKTAGEDLMKLDINESNDVCTDESCTRVPDSSIEAVEDGSVLSSDLIADQQSDDETDDVDTSDDDEDGGGWITPDNIAQVKA